MIFAKRAAIQDGALSGMESKWHRSAADTEE